MHFCYCLTPVFTVFRQCASLNQLQCHVFVWHRVHVRSHPGSRNEMTRGSERPHKTAKWENITLSVWLHLSAHAEKRAKKRKAIESHKWIPLGQVSACNKLHHPAVCPVHHLLRNHANQHALVQFDVPLPRHKLSGEHFKLESLELEVGKWQTFGTCPTQLPKVEVTD